MITVQYSKHNKLDLYLPTEETRKFTTLVWFHGGSLKRGTRSVPDIDDKNIARVAVQYRLAPTHPSCILSDCKKAVRWVKENIGKYGGDKNKIVIGGFSAGAYLSLMIGMNDLSLAGVIAISGQTTKHFTVKELLGDTDPSLVPKIDKWAPLYYVNQETPPILLVVGDRYIEWECRVSENMLLADSIKELTKNRVEFYEIKGHTHMTVMQPALILIERFVRKIPLQ